MGLRLILSNADFSKNAVDKVELVDTTTYDSDVLNYITEVKKVDSGFNESLYKNALNVFVKKLKLFDLWDKIHYINFFLGTTKESQSINIKNPTLNVVKFYPRTENVDGVESILYTEEGCEIHNKGVQYPGISVSQYNVAALPIPNEIIGSNDFSISVTGIIKDSSFGYKGAMALGVTSTDSFINKIVVGKSGIGGIGSQKIDFDTSLLSDMFIHKSCATFSYKEKIFKAWVNKDLRVIAENIKAVDFNSLGGFIGFGVSVIIANRSFVNSNGDLITETLIDKYYSGNNCIYDNIMVSKTLEQKEIETFIMLTNEFRASIGRTIIPLSNI